MTVKLGLCFWQKPEVKRMWEMHVALNRMNLVAKSCEPVVTKLTQVVASPSYLSCKEGRSFIGFTLTLDIKYIKVGCRSYLYLRQLLPHRSKPVVTKLTQVMDPLLLVHTPLCRPFRKKGCKTPGHYKHCYGTGLRRGYLPA